MKKENFSSCLFKEWYHGPDMVDLECTKNCRLTLSHGSNTLTLLPLLLRCSDDRHMSQCQIHSFYNNIGRAKLKVHYVEMNVCANIKK